MTLTQKCCNNSWGSDAAAICKKSQSCCGGYFNPNQCIDDNDPNQFCCGGDGGAKCMNDSNHVCCGPIWPGSNSFGCADLSKG